MEWKWIALLPFIDAPRLQKHVKLVSNMFTAEQTERNRIKSHVVLVHRTESSLGKMLENVLPKEDQKVTSDTSDTATTVEPQLGKTIFFLTLHFDSSCHTDFSSSLMHV